MDGWMDNFIKDSIHSTCITKVHIHQHIKNRPRHSTASLQALRTGQTMGQIESPGQVVPSS